jgi:hypothetical protein
MHFRKLVLIFLCLAGFSATAQKDVIITQAGEEIRCRILDETPTRFKYAYLGPNNKILRNEIFKNLVSSFKYNYYDRDLLKNEKEIVRVPVSKKESKEDPKAKEEIDSKKVIVENKKPVDVPKPQVDLNKPSYPVNQNKTSQSPAVTTNPINVEEPKAEPKPEEKPKIESAKVADAKPIVNPSFESKPISSPENIKTPEINLTKEEVLPKTVEPPVKNDTKLNSKTNKKDSKKPELKENKPPKEEIKPIESSKPVVELASKELKLEDKISVPNNVESKPEQNNTVKVQPKEPEALIKEKVIETAKTDKKEEEPKKKAEIKTNPIKTPSPAPKESKDILADKKPKSDYKDFMRFRVGIKGGLGNVIIKDTDTSPYGLYKEKLQRGWMFGADATYFLNDFFGLGVKYNSLQTTNNSNKLDFLNPITDLEIKNGALSNRVSQKFIGPSIVLRKSFDFKTYLVLNLSPGVNLYTDKGIVNAANYKFTGFSYGGNASLGIDFLMGNDIFGRDIIFTIEAGYNYGEISKITQSGANLSKIPGKPISLNRLDFGLGLRFTRFPMYLR